MRSLKTSSARPPWIACPDRRHGTERRIWATRDGSYRRIRVEVHRRGVTVRYKAGYFALAQPCSLRTALRARSI